LTIGKIKGGERRNVIAGKLYMEGTLRAFNESVYKKVKNKMISFAKGLEISYGSKIEIVFRDMYPPVNNNEKLVENFIEIVGYENLKIIEPQMTAEDFSYYQKKIPGLFFFLGVKNQEKGHTFPLHNSKFNFNDEILITGIQIYADLLNENDGLDI
jgi:metal-dependent amidase/aminoacylase/carboxypeptidase family protein